MDAITYKLPWENLENGHFAEEELAKEISSKHSLHGIKVKAIARRVDCDDFLFALMDETKRYALVHLTFIGKTEKDPRFPGTSIFKNLDDWIKNIMEPDAEEFDLEDF